MSACGHAVIITARLSMLAGVGTMSESAAVDPRLSLIDLDVLDWELFPPIADWDDDDWAEAYELTMSARAEAEMREGNRRWTPLEEFEAELDADSAAAG